MTGFARFAALDEADCRDLLRTHKIGRVGWQADPGPTILPVNYQLDGSEIIFRTSSTGLLGELRDGTPVAFEVDEFDEETRTGWSVLARGTVSVPSSPEDKAWLWRNDPPVPWAGHERAEFVSISIQELSGRIVSGD